MRVDGNAGNGTGPEDSQHDADEGDERAADESLCADASSTNHGDLSIGRQGIRSPASAMMAQMRVEAFANCKLCASGASGIEIGGIEIDLNADRLGE